MDGMDGCAIAARGLCKTFKLYAHPRQILSEALLGAVVPVFEALTDITFTVSPGEVVGVMGRNGAGKSTLLRIIAGTLNATSGRALVNGRVAAILELGSGFNPEYTGRENIVSGGMCMGMNRAEIMDRMESIIAFSELGDCIDHPFKTYSSGMQARLTFATAISVDPEILIVDEALSVGDARFQAKCFDRFQEFRDAGKSILLVSHSDNVIARFCDRAIVLERGRLLLDDAPVRALNAYSDLLYGRGGSVETGRVVPATADPGAAPEGETMELDADGRPIPLTAVERERLKARRMEELGIPAFEPDGEFDRLGDRRKAEILDLRATDTDGAGVVRFEAKRGYRFVILVLFYEPVAKFVVGASLRSSKGLTVYGSTTKIQNDDRRCFRDARRGDVIRCVADADYVLTNDTFMLTMAVADDSDGDSVIMDGLCDALLLPTPSNPALFDSSIADLGVRFGAEKVRGPTDGNGQHRQPRL